MLDVNFKSKVFQGNFNDAYIWGNIYFHISNVVQQIHDCEKRLKNFILVSCLFETKKNNEILM